MHYVRVGLIYKQHGLFAGNIKRCAIFLRTFFDRCESEINVAPSQAYFLQKRRGGVWASLSPHAIWICVDTLIPCPSVVDKEGADTVGVHSSQTITFRMMITTTHFCGIEERSHVFIPLEFKHHRDTRPLWRPAFFSYLDGVWEWVQVTSDHVANHYTALAHAYAMTETSSQTHPQVSSTVPPTECPLQLPYFLLDYHTRGEPQPALRVQSGMLRSTLDLQTLPADGTLGKNTSN